MKLWPQRKPGKDIGLADKCAVKVFLVGLATVSLSTVVVYLVLTVWQ